MTTHAQTLDQTLSGCNGAAPLRTIQANPSNYKSHAWRDAGGSQRFNTASASPLY